MKLRDVVACQIQVILMCFFQSAINIVYWPCKLYLVFLSWGINQIVRKFIVLIFLTGVLRFNGYVLGINVSIKSIKSVMFLDKFYFL